MIWDERLTRRGVKLLRAPQAGFVWRVVKAEWLDEKQSQGRHHIYADTLDEQGRRIAGVTLIVTWPTGRHEIVSEAKPGEPYAANFPMSPSRNEFAIRVRDGASDELTGIGMGADMGGGFNPNIHTSTAVVFQRSTGVPVTPPVAPPATDTWRRSYAFVQRWEGGYQAHPDDPGNWTGGQKGVGILKGTKFGISAASYPHLDIANLTREQAEAIYLRDYWERSGAHRMPWPLCLLVLDTAVLHGTGTATKWLAEVGPNPYAFAARRLEVYTRSANWGNFGRGWTNRAAALLREMGAT